jgi:hypothetical protein
MFRVAADEFVVSLNVMPDASPRWRTKYPDLFSAEHLRRRKEFYGVDDPENIPVAQMMKTYSAIAADNGYKILWHYSLKRSLTYYLAMHLKKT